MSLHSNLAGRLSVGSGRSSQRWKGGGSGRDGLGMQNRVLQRSTGVRRALAQRLGVPSTESAGSRRSVGIKARLGNVQRGPGEPVTAGHIWQKEEEYNSLYPTTNELRDVVAAERQQQRKKARSIAVTARRGMQESGTRPPSSPVMVKMASGKLVGGMRSDQIQKGPQSPATNTRVAMDASRGLTVSIPNKRRLPPHSRFGSRSGDASRQEQWSGGRGNMYSEHDDRADPASRRGRAGADLHSDWDYSEEDVGLELRSRRRHDTDCMDVDSNAGGDVYNASLQYTRTTTHHHHHHHGPSPPPQPPLFAVYGGGYRYEGSPPPQKVLYRRASPRRGGRYENAAPHNYSLNYSPPPPPSPPSFHPRYRYAPPMSSSPSPPSKNRQQFVEVVKNKTSKSRVAAKAHSYKAALKTARLVKRGKIIKPAKKVKKLKTTLKGSAIKARQGKLKKKKKLHSMIHASSPDSVSSDSDQDASSSSSSSGSSSSESSYPERSHHVVYKPPVERVLPEPHKQVLDQQVRACIAALQGKEPDYTSGPGPGVKNLVFVPTMTTKPLHQRFTVDSGR